MIMIVLFCLFCLFCPTKTHSPPHSVRQAPVQKHVGNDMNDDSETRFGAGHQGGKPTVKVQVKEEVDSNFVIIKRIPDQEFKEICPDNNESFTEFDKFLMSRLLGSSCLIDKEAITKIDLLFIKIRDKGVLTSAENNEDEEIERNPKSELNFLKEHHFWDQNQKMLQIRQKCWEELKDYADFDNNSMISKNEFRMFFIQKALLVDIDPVDTQEAKNKKVELNLHLPKEYKESIHRRKSTYDHLEEWHRHFNVRLQNFIKIFKMRHHYGE
jgi:hypothetical protein